MRKQKVNGTIEHVHKNYRYKIYKTDQDTYLKDFQQHVLSSILPFLNWFPLKVCKLNEDEYKGLKVITKHRKHNKNDVLMMGGISVLLSSLIRPLIHISTHSFNFKMAIGIVSVVFLAVILFYAYLHFKLKLENYNFKRSQLYLRLRPSFKFKFTFVLVSLFICAFIYSFIVDILTTNQFNMIIFIVFVSFLFIIGLLNSVPCNIGKVIAVLYVKD
ncbi:DUF443 family protein [Staphylococcus agnetis]|uniref:DUF443 family protein n=1 Tax=Staphylococcus agnetis TaxID=985762 RepID=UPI000D1BC049|nr:DUF443 family protein [Staphylococcus agnetis]NJH86963.1 DUF443 family protein [Staphylococcus agnetis]NJI16635.1 DUF443 family protein [Staphylococcus agnetis]PTH36899.1 hypothetical protein BU588_12365 [Staphylococcus agnetis]